MTTRFTEDHEWVRLEGDVAVVGITAYAAQELGQVVYVELPEVGARFAQGADMAVVESAKAASDVYAPVSGEVIAVNTSLATNFGDWTCNSSIANFGSANGACTSLPTT